MIAPIELQGGASTFAGPQAGPESSREAAPVEEMEGCRVLLARLHRKTGSIPPELLVKHLLRVTRGADWPVQREAAEALLRRLSFGGRDRLQIASRPTAPAVFGLYRTSRGRSVARPYNTALTSFDPPAGSCDCPDFLRNSLGLCKHLLAVLDSIAAKPSRLRRALGGGDGPADATGRGLRWSPLRPLTGTGDWMQGIRWVEPPRETARARASFPRRLLHRRGGAAAPDAEHRRAAR